MCCINAIRSTEDALEAYLTETSNQTQMELGKAYLLVYGVFQALSVQQDAVKILCCTLKSFGVVYPEDPDIAEIREIRKDIGHPIDRHDKPILGKSFYEIQGFFRPGCVQMVVNHPEYGKKMQQSDQKTISVGAHKFIDIPLQIDKQKTVFIRVLDSVLEKLTAEIS